MNPETTLYIVFCYEHRYSDPQAFLAAPGWETIPIPEDVVWGCYRCGEDLYVHEFNETLSPEEIYNEMRYIDLNFSVMEDGYVFHPYDYATPLERRRLCELFNHYVTKGGYPFYLKTISPAIGFDTNE